MLFLSAKVPYLSVENIKCDDACSIIDTDFEISHVEVDPIINN